MFGGMTERRPPMNGLATQELVTTKPGSAPAPTGNEPSGEPLSYLPMRRRRRRSEPVSTIGLCALSRASNPTNVRLLSMPSHVPGQKQ